MRRATPDDLPALRELFARANDTPYDLAAVAEEKCFGPGISGEPVTRVIEKEGKVIAAAVTCGKWLRILAVDRDHRRRGHGTALLQGEVIAAEPGNYFTPGIVDTDQATFAFLRARGYRPGAETHNLVCVPRKTTTSAVRATHADRDRILDFIGREFGRIWRFEAGKAFDEPVPPLFYIEAGGEIAGFAAHDINNRGLGWFGPTGVAKSQRGRGLGRELLLASLSDLAGTHAEVVIPWTDALEFYARSCGAEPAHRFVAFTREQTVDSAP